MALPAPILRRSLVAGLLALLGLACLGHTLLVVVRGAGAGAWPAPLAGPELDWVAARTAGIGTLGLVPDGLELEPSTVSDAALLLFRVQHAVIPAYVVHSPRDTSVVLFAPGTDRAALAGRLAADGYRDVVFDERHDLALASRTSLATAAVDGPLPRVPAVRAALLLGAFAGVLALVAGILGGWLALFLTLLGAPAALAIASVLGDLTPAPVAVTAAGFVAVLVLWVAAVVRLPTDDPLRAARPAIESARPAPFLLGSVLLALLALGAAILALGWSPEGGWDAQAMFNMRARFIVVADDFRAPFAEIEGFRNLHGDYPPLIPFAVAGGWRLVGGSTPLVPMALQLATWLGFAGFLGWWALRERGRWFASAAIVLLLFTPVLHERLADQACDLPTGFLFASAVLAWLAGRHLRADGRLHAQRWMLVSGVLLGCAAATKNEGLLLAVIWLGLLAALAVRGPPHRRSDLAWVAAGSAPLLVLLLLFKGIAPPNDLVAAFDPGRASAARALAVARHFGALALRPREFHAVFAIVSIPALLALLAGARRWWRGEDGAGVARALLAAALVLAVAAFFLVYVTTPYDLTWHLSTSADRLFVQLYPATIVLGLSLAAGALDRRTHERRGT